MEIFPFQISLKSCFVSNSSIYKYYCEIKKEFIVYFFKNLVLINDIILIVSILQLLKDFEELVFNSNLLILRF